jgi:hypothetical protein
MTEKLSGIVAEAESWRLTIEPFTSGVILRPVETWHEPIVIGKDVKLVLSNGDCCQTRATGFEMGENAKGLLVKEIPGVTNENLLGAKLYVLAE